MSIEHPDPQLLLAHVRCGQPLSEGNLAHVQRCDHCANTLDLLAMAALNARATDPHHLAHADTISEEDIGDWIVGALDPNRAQEVKTLVDACQICASLAEGIRAELALLADAEAFTSDAHPEDEMTPDTPRLSFDIIKDGQTLTSLTLPLGTVTIGADSACQIHLTGSGVADLHAVIKAGEDGPIRLTDPGDAGITANGRPVDVRAELGDSAEISLAGYTLILRRILPAEPTAEPPTTHAEQAEAALNEDVLDTLGQAWRKHDELKLDDPKKAKVLEIRELWGDMLLDVRYFGHSEASIRLGEKVRPRPTFFMPAERLPEDGFELLVRRGGHWHLRFVPTFRGFVEMEGIQIPLGDLISTGEASPLGTSGVFELPLTDKHRFVIAIGADILSGAFVPQPKALPTHFELDIPLTGTFLGVLAMALITIVLVSQMPPPPEPGFDDMPDRFVQLLKKQPEALPPPKEKLKPLERKEKGDEGERAKLDEGKKGKKDKKVEKAKGNQVALDKLKKDRETAENAGLLGADLDAMANLFGSGGLDSQVTSAASGLSAKAIGAVGGSGGRGGRGMGPGGGGSAEGIGGLGTRGGGTGGGGYGADAGYSGKKKKANLDIGGQGAIVIGQAIDPSLIDKAIRAHTAQIRYCYSRELNKNPRLFGKVVIKFVIGSAGTVVSSSVKESTVNNGAVENCVADRVTRIQFPKPKGGVNVTVIYPFNFNAAG